MTNDTHAHAPGTSCHHCAASADTRAAHTPGPWKVEGWNVATGRDTCRTRWTVRNADGRTLDTIDMRESDARLIAAAPDLLAALESLVKYAENSRYISPRGMDACLAARAAIRKATGEGA